MRGARRIHSGRRGRNRRFHAFLSLGLVGIAADWPVVLPELFKMISPTIDRPRLLGLLGKTRDARANLVVCGRCPLFDWCNGRSLAWHHRAGAALGVV